MWLALQILMFVVYVVGFLFCFHIFAGIPDRSLAVDEDELNDSQAYSLAVIVSVFWPLLAVFAIGILLYCFIHSLFTK